MSLEKAARAVVDAWEYMDAQSPEFFELVKSLRAALDRDEGVVVEVAHNYRTGHAELVDGQDMFLLLAEVVHRGDTSRNLFIDGTRLRITRED